MKKSLIILVLFALVACTASEKSESSNEVTPIEKNEDVTVSQLQQAIMSDSAIFLVDVRTVGEYKDAHIAECRLRFSYDSLTANLAKLPENKDSEIFFYCRTGRRSGIVSNQLRELGYTNVHNVLGGIVDWRKKGFEVVTGEN